MYATELPKGFHAKHPLYDKMNCDNVLSLSLSDNADCWSIIKNTNVITPLQEFEVALVNALDHIGIRTPILPAQNNVHAPVVQDRKTK